MFAVFLPSVPQWNHVHPLIVHFPIALLMIAPLFILGGVFAGAKNGRPYMIAGFCLLVLGTVGAFLAGVTGDAASESAPRTATIAAVLEKHEELAETTQMVFSLLTVAFGAVLFLPSLLRKQTPRAFARVIPLLLLALYVGGVGLLINTAQDGGKLVHEMGIHSGVTAASTSQPTSIDRD